MAKTVLVKADRIVKRKKFIKYLKITAISLIVLLTAVFIILSIIYNGGRFTITLDPNFALESGIVIYDKKDDKRATRKLYADDLHFLDNISIKWLPDDIHDKHEGSHNGNNYIAYSFYVENEGKRVVNYWYEIVIDDVIKRVDDAVRIMVFLNGEKSVYAKINAETKEAEPNTIEFRSKDLAVLEERSDFAPGTIDKITVVVWLEGDDPDCVDAILGGEIKMRMNITEEHVEQEVDKK